jgi:AmmeMemoRadiSam system protein A
MSEPTLFTPEHQRILLKVAVNSIEHGLHHHQAIEVKLPDYPAELLVERAVFVTLTIHENLRGCIGTLESSRPLVANVAQYAYAAAFTDPRFPQLRANEFPPLAIQISILGELEPIRFDSEEDLLSQIRPGLDGLLLEEGSHRGTLLPSVWEDISDKKRFLQILKRKAGLAMDYWSPHLRVRRYATTCLEGTVAALAANP